MKKRNVTIAVGLLLLISAIIFQIKKQSSPILLELGMFAESNWNVENANAYVIVDKAIEKFEKLHPGVKIHYESGVRKNDYSEWLARKVLRGKTPDVFMILSDDFYDYASKNVIQNLDGLIANDRNFYKQYYYFSTLKTGQFDNKQYALPYEAVPTLMFVNKSLLNSEGIAVPEDDWTWRDLENIASIITKDKNGDGVVDQFATYNYTWKEAAYSNGTDAFDIDGATAYFSDPKMEEAVRYVKELSDLNEGRTVTQDDFDEGNVAFMPLSFAEYRTYKTYPYKIRKYADFQWECITMPAGPEGDNISEVDTLMMVMSRKTKYQKLAWEFMKLLTSDSEIQRYIFQYSQGASVLKYVTGSKYAESIIRKDMDVTERVIDNDLLDSVIESGKVKPRFRMYPEAMSLAESRINDIYKNEKNIDSSLKIFQRDISKFLKE